MYSLPIINSLRVPVIIIILWCYFAIPFFVLHVNFNLLLHNKLHLMIMCKVIELEHFIFMIVHQHATLACDKLYLLNGHDFCYLVEAQICNCTEISTTMDSSGSDMPGSGDETLNITGTYMSLLYCKPCMQHICSNSNFLFIMCSCKYGNHEQ